MNTKKMLKRTLVRLSLPLLLIPSTVMPLSCLYPQNSDDCPPEDPIPPETILTEQEAIDLTEKILIERSNTYKEFFKNAFLSIDLSGESHNFYVDYLIKKLNDTDAVINYVGHIKNLEEEKSNKNLLDIIEVPNLYLIGLSEDKMKLELNEFIDGEYN